MTVVSTTLLRPDGVTPYGGRPITIGQVGATLTSGGKVVDRIRKLSDPVTGAISFDLPASATGSYYVWTWPDGTQVKFVMPAAGGPYTLAALAPTSLPSTPSGGVSPDDLRSAVGATIPKPGSPVDGQLLSYSATLAQWRAINPVGVAQAAAAVNNTGTTTSCSASSGVGTAVDIPGCSVTVQPSNGLPVTVEFSTLVGQTVAGAGSIYLNLVNVTTGANVGLAVQPLPNTTAQSGYLVPIGTKVDVGPITTATVFKLQIQLFSPSGSAPTAAALNIAAAPSRIRALVG